MDLSTLPVSVVQILYLILSSEDNLDSKDTTLGTIWHDALREISSSKDCSGYRWGRSVEEPKKIQLHISKSAVLLD